jgi:hypothetical protein
MPKKPTIFCLWGEREVEEYVCVLAIGEFVFVRILVKFRNLHLRSFCLVWEKKERGERKTFREPPTPSLSYWF